MLSIDMHAMHQTPHHRQVMSRKQRRVNKRIRIETRNEKRWGKKKKTKLNRLAEWKKKKEHGKKGRKGYVHLTETTETGIETGEHPW